jgi:hypothetical protein
MFTAETSMPVKARSYIKSLTLTPAFFSRLQQQRIARAPFLEIAGALEVIQFAKEARPDNFRKRMGFLAWGEPDAARNSPPRLFNVFQCDRYGHKTYC